MPTTRSPFLDDLPPEIRLQIYTHLLVASTPLKGTIARRQHSETYGVHTSILRLNKQIHAESRPVFFGKNTFYISSIPPQAITTAEAEASGAFEPPLQLRDLPLVQNLQIDLLYYPRVLKTVISRDPLAWQPLCTGAVRYATSLSYILGAVKNSLASLKLAADVRPYAASAVEKDDETFSVAGTPIVELEGMAEEALDVKKFLTGFFTADKNARFREALGTLRLETVDLRFDFAESYFEFAVKNKALLRRSLAHVAGQVLIARSEIRMRAVMEELGDEFGRSVGGGEGEARSLMQLMPEIELKWPCVDLKSNSLPTTGYEK